MSGIREIARIFELIAKLTGQLDEGDRVQPPAAEGSRAGTSAGALDGS